MDNTKKAHDLEAAGTGPGPLGSGEGETTTYKNMGFCGFAVGSNSACVDVKNGRVVR